MEGATSGRDVPALRERFKLASRGEFLTGEQENNFWEGAERKQQRHARRREASGACLWVGWGWDGQSMVSSGERGV